jgi:ribosomal protein S27AE
MSDWHKLDGNMRAADDHYDGKDDACPECGADVAMFDGDWYCDKCEWSKLGDPEQ